LLVVLAVGPARTARWFRRGWRWLWEKRQEPEEILAEVVKRYETHVRDLHEALRQAETAESQIARNIAESEAHVPMLETEARERTGRGDDLGARAALYKLNLEKAAVASFRQHLARQRQDIEESRRRLYLLELQLRQYEVGRTILLSQLAQAKTLEQQYAIANQFDPFSAVANWQRAEGMVQDKALTALAAERVHADTTNPALAGPIASIDSGVLDRQLAELKARLRHDAADALGDHQRPEPERTDDKPRDRLREM